MYELKEYSQNELPESDAAIQKGLEFALSIESSWPKSKEIDGTQTYLEWIDNQFWAARVSYHDDITYEEFKNTVLHNHTENEAEYIGMVDNYKILDGYKDWVSRQVHYKFPFPLRNRDMIIWLTSKETQPASQFVVVTVPRKYSSPYTKAVYVSVEVVTRLADGRVQWIMGTTSDACGWIPQFVQRPKMSNAVAEDVPQFQAWIKGWRKKQAG